MNDISNLLGKRVLILEKRNHIGGNCYDYTDEETGILVSLYGVHLFHTKVKEVWAYLKKFTRWSFHEHRVV